MSISISICISIAILGIDKGNEQEENGKKERTKKKEGWSEYVTNAQLLLFYFFFSPLYFSTAYTKKWRKPKFFRRNKRRKMFRRGATGGETTLSKFDEPSFCKLRVLRQRVSLGMVHRYRSEKKPTWLKEQVPFTSTPCPTIDHKVVQSNVTYFRSSRAGKHYLASSEDES